MGSTCIAGGFIVWDTIMTTRQTGGLLAPIRGSYRPASKGAGFHFVQALMPLTRSYP